jgi:hypothetical protein
MHQATDPLVQHLRQQMHVIGHQAVSIQVEGSLGFLGLEKSEKLKVVIVGMENAPAIIATSDDVVRGRQLFQFSVSSPRVASSILCKRSSVVFVGC